MLTINPYRLGNNFNKKLTKQEKMQAMSVNFQQSPDTVSFSGGRIRKGFFNQIIPREAYIFAKKKTMAFTKLLKDGTIAELGYLKGKKEYEVLENGVFLTNKEFSPSGKLTQLNKFQYTDETQEFLFKEENIDYIKNASTTTLYGPKNKVREVTFKNPEFTEFRKCDIDGNLISVEVNYVTPTGCKIKQIYDPNSPEYSLLEEFQTELDGTQSHLFYKQNIPYKISVEKSASDGVKITTEDEYIAKKLSQRTVRYSDGETLIYTFKPGGENISNSARIIKLPDGTVCREEKYYGNSITAEHGLVYENDQLLYKTKYDYKDHLSEAMDTEGYLVPLKQFGVFAEDSYREINTLKEWQNLSVSEEQFDFLLGKCIN